MSKTYEIDGKTYVEVGREAKVGDSILIVDADMTGGAYENGDVLVVTKENGEAGVFCEEIANESNWDGQVDDYEYVVIEPVASEAPPLELTANDIRWQPDKVIDLLANLARRVSSLERQNDDQLETLEEQALRITSLEQQLSDTQNNVIRQAEELAANEHSISELYGRLAHVEADVESVEDRTASHRDELNVIDHEKAMIFEDIVSLSKRIKKLNGGAAE